MNIAELGETFRTARIAANLTQQDVAQRAGVSRARISLFETGVLPEIGAVKLLSLFDAVGLELIARAPGHHRTLDDVTNEREVSDTDVSRRRVRNSVQRQVTRGKQ